MTYKPYDILTESIISAGMKLLRENLGVLETEIFITHVCRSDFDYTVWREGLYDNMSLEELLAHASEVTRNYKPPERVKVL